MNGKRGMLYIPKDFFKKGTRKSV